MTKKSSRRQIIETMIADLTDPSNLWSPGMRYPTFPKDMPVPMVGFVMGYACYCEHDWETDRFFENGKRLVNRLPETLDSTDETEVTKLLLGTMIREVAVNAVAMARDQASKIKSTDPILLERLADLCSGAVGASLTAISRVNSDDLLDRKNPLSDFVRINSALAEVASHGRHLERPEAGKADHARACYHVATTMFHVVEVIKSLRQNLPEDYRILYLAGRDLGIAAAGAENSFTLAGLEPNSFGEKIFDEMGYGSTRKMRMN